jgi:hypothetical protein
LPERQPVEVVDASNRISLDLGLSLGPGHRRRRRRGSLRLDSLWSGTASG